MREIQLFLRLPSNECFTLSLVLFKGKKGGKSQLAIHPLSSISKENDFIFIKEGVPGTDGAIPLDPALIVPNDDISFTEG